VSGGGGNPRARRLSTRKAHLDQVRNDINVTPLVDVMLVLLIIFMVVTPLLEKDIGVRVPATEQVEEIQEVPPDQAGRLVLPPTSGVDRTEHAPAPVEVRVGGVDEGGLIGTRRDIELNDAAGGGSGATASPEPGFRWPVNGQTRLRLVYRVGESTDELTHEWTIRRSQ
jgi:hypothetical protein